MAPSKEKENKKTENISDTFPGVGFYRKFRSFFFHEEIRNKNKRENSSKRRKTFTRSDILV